MNFIEELRWRGMLHDMMPGTEEFLNGGVRRAYIGFDPTADSLHIGHLCQIMTLNHFQRMGHQPIALVGGATGMVGDPSGKSAERNLLNEADLQHNVACIKAQLERFLDFDCGDRSAVLVNNYDWFKGYDFLGFIRDVGKHITVNYMMAKDSVKKRLEGDTGMSFTEFSYQLVQGYDFYYLWKNMQCSLQMGGSDQWGNIVTGTELIRRKDAGEAFAVTTQLIKKADGTKFGKTESGAIWLDAKRTSPYKFYQFWLNTSDDDAKSWIKIFTTLDKATIDNLEAEHAAAPHLRILQKALGKEITIKVHSEKDYETAVLASDILFGKSTTEDFNKLDEKTFLEIFEGVPQAKSPCGTFSEGFDVINLFSTVSTFLPSNAEVRRALKENSLSVNKEKVTEEFVLTEAHLIGNKYVLLQRGKKSYFLVVFED